MSAARVGALVRQEAWHGSRSVLLVWALAAPVAITLMINLVFGSILAPAPRLGIVDAGGSALTAVAGADEALRTRVYADVDALRVAVEAGSVDMGIVLPAGFDDALATGLPTAVQTFVWGQSLASDRASSRPSPRWPGRWRGATRAWCWRPRWWGRPRRSRCASGCCPWWC